MLLNFRFLAGNGFVLYRGRAITLNGCTTITQIHFNGHLSGLPTSGIGISNIELLITVVSMFHLSKYIKVSVLELQLGFDLVTAGRGF